MSKNYEKIFSETFDDFKKIQDGKIIIERNRIAGYCQIRIDNHIGCRGLVSTCEQCIVLRQVINFVNGEDNV
jgi:hypothetical protein